MCKDMELIKNTCSRDLKEILYGLRPEVEPVKKIIGKHMRERQSSLPHKHRVVSNQRCVELLP